MLGRVEETDLCIEGGGEFHENSMERLVFDLLED